MRGRGDAGPASQTQRNLLPGFHAVIVGLLRKLGDGEVAVLVDDRRLRARTAQGGAGSEDELEIVVGFLVAENPLGAPKQAAKLNQSRHPRADWSLERVAPGPTEAQCAQPGLVGHTQEIVALQERANGAAFAFGTAALGALHQPAAPGIGR